MCGITGIINLSKGLTSFSGNDLIKMSYTLKHRGPNDMGAIAFSCGSIVDYKKNYKVFNETNLNIGFAHQRLSIIDLSLRGHQPMSDSQEKIWIVFNGEIYNYIELRVELKNLGYKFRSDSDTEVIIYSYIQWGTDCFNKFNGMWAIALYDTIKDNVVLSRDRLGKKPFYYTIINNCLVFSSEIKAFREIKQIDLKPNFKKIISYSARHYRYVDNDEESFFENIFQVPKSSYMIIKNGNISTSKYWNLSISDKTIKTDFEVIEEFKKLFIDSVKLRLRSDVPVAMNLSGGLDSTSITCVAAKELNVNVKTFSGVTGSGRFDESEYIDEVVRDVGADHAYFYPEPSNLFETIERMLYFHDEPICTVTWYSLFHIAEKISHAGIPVVLTGHGGDELFGGYWDHYHYNLFDLQTNQLKNQYEIEKTLWSQNHNRSSEELDRMKLYIKETIEDENREINFYSKYLHVIKDGLLNKSTFSFPKFTSNYGALNRRLYLELFYETVPSSLRPEDRNTMAFSIESRIPFLDYRLIEFAFSLPNRFKIRNGLGKWLIRESMKGILPEKVRTRKDKAGFVAPASEWFKTKNQEQIRELFNSNLIKKIGIFNIDNVNNIFNDHIEGKADHHMAIWNWINICLWYNKFWI